MLESAERVTSFTAGIDFEAFTANRMAISADLYEIQTIGEAARHIPDGIQARYSDVEWAQIRGMRNIVVHAYDVVCLDVVWGVVEHRIPSLMPRLREILELERVGESD